MVGGTTGVSIAPSTSVLASSVLAGSTVHGMWKRRVSCEGGAQGSGALKAGRRWWAHHSADGDAPATTYIANDTVVEGSGDEVYAGADGSESSHASASMLESVKTREFEACSLIGIQRQIKIDDQLHTRYIYPPVHEVCAYQHLHHPTLKLIVHLQPLLLIH